MRNHRVGGGYNTSVIEVPYKVQPVMRAGGKLYGKWYATIERPVTE